MRSENLNELAKSLAKAQGEMKAAVKDSENPFFKSKYADLSSVWEAIRVPFTTNGLSITQTTQLVGERLVLDTTLLHVSGQFITSQYPIVSQKGDPQSLGSAMTYARRYTLAAIAGVYQNDDDAEAAVVRQPQRPINRPVPRETN